MIRPQTSAGGIIVRRGGPDIQVCLILDDYGVWALPKGKVEPGESLEETALREVCEEVGLSDVRVVRDVGSTKYRFPLGGDIFKKTVHWFLMEAPPDAEVRPIHSEHVRDAGWFTPQQALTMIGYRNLRSLVRKALQGLELKQQT